MKIEMRTLKENDDGSADVEFEMDDEAKQWIVTTGIEAMLKLAIQQAQCIPVPNAKSREVVAMQAVEKAQTFVESEKDGLGIFTLRKAYEQGFVAGAMWMATGGSNGTA